MGRFSNIQLRVFLRTDIWSDLNFTNKSHLSDKTVRLDWDKNRLLKLINKRIVTVPESKEYINNSLEDDIDLQDIESHDEDTQENIFYSVFDEQVYSGPREADLFDWMIERITDGLGGVYPRELISFCNEAKDLQLQDGPSSDNILIDGLSVRDAYYIVSRQRVDTYLSEFPELNDHFNKFDGKTKSTFSRSELKNMFSNLNLEGGEAIERMYDVGFLKPKQKNAKHLADEFEIPRLYRDGIGLVIRGRP